MTVRARSSATHRIVWLLVVAGTIALAAALPLAVRARFEGFAIPSASMAPTLLEGDYILVDKAVRWPVRGDLIVFREAGDANDVLVKRVVGLGGEEISIRGHDVYINCEAGTAGCLPVAEPYADFTGEVRSPRDVEPLEIPADTFFVLADNRNAGEDSRHWGPISKAQVIGRAVRIYWSSDVRGSTRWERVGHRIQ